MNFGGYLYILPSILYNDSFQLLYEECLVYFSIVCITVDILG